MRKQRHFHSIIAWAVTLFVMAGFACESAAGETVASGHYRFGNSAPTAAGESGLNHRHRAFDETSMG